MIYEWWVFHIYVSITVGKKQDGNHQKRSTKRLRKQLHPRASPAQHSSPRKIHEARAKTKEKRKGIAISSMIPTIDIPILLVVPEGILYKILIPYAAAGIFFNKSQNQPFFGRNIYQQHVGMIILWFLWYWNLIITIHHNHIPYRIHHRIEQRHITTGHLIFHRIGWDNFNWKALSISLVVKTHGVPVKIFSNKPIPLTSSHDLSRGASGAFSASGGGGDGRDAATDAGRGAAKKTARGGWHAGWHSRDSGKKNRRFLGLLMLVYFG